MIEPDSGGTDQVRQKNRGQKNRERILNVRSGRCQRKLGDLEKSRFQKPVELLLFAIHVSVPHLSVARIPLPRIDDGSLAIPASRLFTELKSQEFRSGDNGRPPFAKLLTFLSFPADRQPKFRPAIVERFFQHRLDDRANKQVDSSEKFVRVQGHRGLRCHYRMVILTTVD